ncbi:hemolymph lipopolysaccharide-binding protein-like [Diprion similis]|uniref:hemolymph lipopolysaccharide-binding protein-like n=1 Tax=Diprion similis TaxID=362088 RepID=UPI001EF8FB1F|nr:hemolymph lipopolysaccharide-binding protein-like [Diprion similis]
MAIILVLLQISLCITLAMAQQPASTNTNEIWLYLPTLDDLIIYVPGIGAYKLHTREVPWNKARTTCEEEGGHLVILNSVSEAKKDSELYNKAGRVTGSAYLFLVSVGFHQFYEEGQFVTIHGQTLAKAGFSEWLDREPDSSDAGQQCGSLERTGRLCDHGCSAPLAFKFTCIVHQTLVSQTGVPDMQNEINAVRPNRIIGALYGRISITKKVKQFIEF